MFLGKCKESSLWRKGILAPKDIETGCPKFCLFFPPVGKKQYQQHEGNLTLQNLQQQKGLVLLIFVILWSCDNLLHKPVAGMSAEDLQIKKGQNLFKELSK